MKQRSPNGFTLIELIISVGLFAVVMLIASGAYFSLIALDRKARATTQIVGSLSFAMDTMTRGIRTGYNFQCLNGTPDGYGNSTTGNCTTFSYLDSNINRTVIYTLKANGSIGRCEGVAIISCPDASASPLTDPAITINKLAFYVTGSGTTVNAPGTPQASQQPHVIFVISGLMPAGSNGQSVPFSLEEGATQRVIDF